MKHAPQAPLFGWQVRRVAALIDADRARLTERIARLPRRSHKRLALELLLAELTRKALADELAVTAADEVGAP